MDLKRAAMGLNFEMQARLPRERFSLYSREIPPVSSLSTAIAVLYTTATVVSSSVAVLYLHCHSRFYLLFSIVVVSLCHEPSSSSSSSILHQPSPSSLSSPPLVGFINHQSFDPILEREEKMSGIIHKIGETLHIGGGNKEGENKSHGDEHHKKPEEHHGGEHHKKPEEHHGGEAHKKPEEHKEGLMDKIKDKIHGGGEEGKHGKEGEKKKKKKKKEKKKHGDGHESSSSSDSD